MADSWECKIENLAPFTSRLDIKVIFWGLRIQTIEIDEDEYGIIGSARIAFETKEDLLKALIRDGMTWEDEIITVEPSNNRSLQGCKNEINDNLSTTELRENKFKDIIGIPMVEIRNVTDMPSETKIPQDYMNCAFVSLENGDLKKCASFLYECADHQLQLFCRKHKQDVKPDEKYSFLSNVFTRMGFEWNQIEDLKESKLLFSKGHYEYQVERVRKFCNYLSLITTLRSEESTEIG